MQKWEMVESSNLVRNILYIFAAIVAWPSHGQSVNAVVLGRVTPRSGVTTKLDYKSVKVQAESRRDGIVRSATVSEGGWYTLLNLPPERYRLRACFEAVNKPCQSSTEWQAREIANLDVPVGGLLRIDLTLRPMAEVYDQGEGLGGEDVEAPVVRRFEADRQPERWVLLTYPRQLYRTLEATLSNTTDPREMRELPYLGRDAYTLLATQGTASSDVTAARGLGVSLGGMRPGTGSFLLDGQTVTSGILAEPLVALSPEAIREYRTSVSNYGVEFGRTAGFVTNAVSRGGGLAWHGIAYAHAGATELNANEFARNAEGKGRLPFEERQSGAQAGGPWGPVRLGGSFDWTRSESVSVEQKLVWPRVPDLLGATSPGQQLLQRYLPVGKADVTEFLAPPVNFRRWSGLARVEGALPWKGTSGFLRVMGSGRNWADFNWSPYPEFVSGLAQPAWAAFGAVTVARGSWTQEASMGWARERVGWERAQDELPGLRLSFGGQLPGSLADGGYEYRRGTGEARYGWTRIAGSHLMKAGGQLFARGSRVASSRGVPGELTYDSISAFGAGRVTSVLLRVLRKDVSAENKLLRVTAPVMQARGSGVDGALYGEDRWRVGRGTALKLGLRLERRSGLGFWPSRWRSEGRLGLSSRWRNTVWRAAYGFFADQPPDSLWLPILTNDTVQVQAEGIGVRFNLPRDQRYAGLVGSTVRLDQTTPLVLAGDLGRGYAQQGLVGMGWNPSRRWSVEANGLRVLGRRLVISDLVNRRTNQVMLRSGAGGSRYEGGTLSVRFEGARWSVHGNYTAARGKDHQSDPYGGAVGDGGLIVARAIAARRADAALMREGDTSGDWGRAGYVQEQAMSVVGLWRSASGKWQVSSVAMLRSGLPYSVLIGRATGDVLRNPRAGLLSGIDPTSRVATTGGERLLRADAFQETAMERNAFTNPGGVSWDVSGQRSFVLRDLWRVSLRTDWFNVLNHANLGPVGGVVVGRDEFGVAKYGRLAGGVGLPFLTPSENAARQVRVMLRVDF